MVGCPVTRVGPLYNAYGEYALEIQYDGRVDVIIDEEVRASGYGIRSTHLIGDALASGLIERAFDEE